MKQPQAPRAPEVAEPLDASLARTLRRAAEGDGEAWAALVRAYSGRVYSLLVRQCRDRDLAEELTQATFVKVVQKLGDTSGGGSGGASGGAAGYEERGRFESWLFRIAMNNLRDEMRRRGRQARAMDMGPGAARGSDEPSQWAAAQAGGMVEEFAGTPATPMNPLEAITQGEQLALLQRAVSQMSEADQQVLYLRHTAGLSFAEIAQTLEQPLGTVLARGHRALKKLRQALEQMGVEA